MVHYLTIIYIYIYNIYIYIIIYIIYIIYIYIKESKKNTRFPLTFTSCLLNFHYRAAGITTVALLD